MDLGEAVGNEGTRQLLKRGTPDQTGARIYDQADLDRLEELEALDTTAFTMLRADVLRVEQQLRGIGDERLARLRALWRRGHRKGRA